jgi:hypothetical protein
MKRSSWLGLITAFGIASAYGCNGGNNTDVVDTDATDMGVDAVPCEDGFVPGQPDSGLCYRAATCDNSAFCPSLHTNDPQHPEFVLSQIDVQTPAVLSATSPVGVILNTAIVEGKFFWGIQLDLAANTIRTGTVTTMGAMQPGSGWFLNDFDFLMGGAPVTDAGTANRWDPVMGTITASGNSISTNTIPLVTVPIYGNPDDAGHSSLLTELPLRNVSMRDVQLNSNANCIGYARSPFNSCIPRKWQTNDPMGDASSSPYGVLEGDITVADAEGIVIVDLPMMPTLCGLIAGTGSNCTDVPMSMWMTPPESTASGSGWHLIANFAAYAVNIR